MSNSGVKVKNKSKIIVAILLVCIIGLLSYYMLYARNSKSIYKSQVTTASKSMQKGLIENNNKLFNLDLANKKYSYTGDVTFTTNYNYNGLDLTDLSDYKLNYDYEISLKDKTMYLDASLNQKDDKLASLISYLKDNIVYYTFPELTDKTIKDDISDKIDFNKLSSDRIISRSELAHIISVGEKSINSYLNDYKFKSKNGSFDGKNAYVSTLTLNPKTKSEMINKMISDYEKDEKASNSFKKMKIDLKETEENDFKYTQMINIYTDRLTRKFIGLTLTGDSDYSLTIKNHENDSQIIIKHGKEDLTLNYDKKTKTLTSKDKIGNYEYELSFVNKGKTINYKITVENGFKLNANGKIEYIANENNENMTINSDIDYITKDNKDYKFGLKFDNKVREIENIKSMDVSNAVTELTEDDASKFNVNLENAFKGTIFERIRNYSNANDDSVNSTDSNDETDDKLEDVSTASGEYISSEIDENGNDSNGTYLDRLYDKLPISKLKDSLTDSMKALK